MPTPIRRGPAGQAPPPPYNGWEEVQRDLIDIFKGEMVALKNEGVRYLQLDKVITTYCNEEARANLAKNGVDPEQALMAEIALENECFEAVRDEGMTLAMHLCRGNRNSFSGGTGGYDWPAEHLFRDLRVDRFLLEYDTERAGGFEPLRFVPEGKIAMLGLLSTKTNRIETKDELLRRIEEASKHCPIERLAIGNQCGFQSAANRGSNSMSIDDQKRKLEVIVQTAREVWG
jgi:5-methyltetrahydropteroyltriglutamate--homocysteine methyltransferase